MRVQSLQLCLTLCYPVNCGPPGSFVHGILQARTLEWVDMPSSREDLSDPEIEPASPMSLALAGEFFTPSTTGEDPSLGQGFLNSALPTLWTQ